MFAYLEESSVDFSMAYFQNRLCIDHVLPNYNWVHVFALSHLMIGQTNMFSSVACSTCYDLKITA